MANKVFISFRFSDGNTYKEELEDLFTGADDVINCSEEVDRNDMSDETIQKYLYSKLKGTSVTIVLLTPKAVTHQKNLYGRYDDWMHDEIRYSLEDRENNRCNGLIAVYTPEAEAFVKRNSHCIRCSENCKLTSVYDFDNLVRKNMMNVKEAYKKNPCDGVYDLELDSYCSLVSFEEFKENYVSLIQNADMKRSETYKYELKKNMNK